MDSSDDENNPYVYDERRPWRRPCREGSCHCGSENSGDDMDEAWDKPYITEYARSARSGCRGCDKLISMKELRLGVLEPSNYHYGNDPKWYHVSCFFSLDWIKKRLLESQIAGFYDLKIEDIRILRKYMAGETPTPVEKPDQEDEDAGIRNSGEFRVEYAKSYNSHCLECGGKIYKHAIRVSQKDYTSVVAKRTPKRYVDRWFHLDCFVKKRQELEFNNGANSISGMSDLRPDDQTILMAKLPRISLTNSNVENNGATQNESMEVDSVVEDQPLDEDEKALLKQDEILESIKEKLGILKEDREQLAEILRDNNQDVPIGVDKMLERVADIMAFGALERCRSCKGQFVLRPGKGYHCIGYVTEYTKCKKKTKDPDRLPFSVSEDLMNVAPFDEFEFTPRSRIIGTLKRKAVDKGENEKKLKLPKIDKVPLLNHTFLISDQCYFSQRLEMKTALLDFGGTILVHLNKKLSAIISDQAEVEDLSNKMDFAKLHCIPVVSQQFVDSVTNVGFDFEATVKKHLLSSWICFGNRQAKSKENIEPLQGPSSAAN